jgi:hypothetical protein
VTARSAVDTAPQRPLEESRGGSMVVFLLCVKADLENVEEIAPEEHLRYCLDVRALAQRSRTQRTRNAA